MKAGEVALIGVVILVTVAVVLFYRRMRSRSHTRMPSCALGTAIDGTGFPEYDERLDHVRRDLMKVGADLAECGARVSELRAQMRAYVGTTYRGLQDSERRLGELILGIIGVIDQVDVMRTAPDLGASEILSSMETRVRQVLAAAGVVEIPVERGKPFSSRFHKYVLEREDTIAAGHIAELVRRGWVVAGTQPGVAPTTVRAAEVVVSRGVETPAPLANAELETEQDDRAGEAERS